MSAELTDVKAIIESSTIKQVTQIKSLSPHTQTKLKALGFSNTNATIHQTREDGLTPLMVFVQGPNTDYNIVKELLESGADLFAKDKFGRTAIWYLLKTRIQCEEYIGAFSENYNYFMDSGRALGFPHHAEWYAKDVTPGYKEYEKQNTSPENIASAASHILNQLFYPKIFAETIAQSKKIKPATTAPAHTTTKDESGLDRLQLMAALTNIITSLQPKTPPENRFNRWSGTLAKVKSSSKYMADLLTIGDCWPIVSNDAWSIDDLEVRFEPWRVLGVPFALINQTLCYSAQTIFSKCESGFWHLGTRISGHKLGDSYHDWEVNKFVDAFLTSDFADILSSKFKDFLDTHAKKDKSGKLETSYPRPAITPALAMHAAAAAVAQASISSQLNPPANASLKLRKSP